MKINKNILAIALLSGTLAGAVTPVSAVPVTIQVTGSILNWDGSLGSEFSDDDALYAEYTYDSLTPDLDPSDPSGRYAITDFWDTLGDYSFSFANGAYTLINDSFLGDQMLVNATVTGADIGDASLVSSLIFFRDYDKEFLSDDSLILHAPDLSIMEQTGFALAFDSDADGRVLTRATIDSVRLVASTPAPSVLLLVSLGLAGISLRVRARQK